MKTHSGFTLLETAIVLGFFALVAIFLTINILDYSAFARDNTRKSDINSLYYALENDFFKSHNYYPETISELNLGTAGAESFLDPAGNAINSPESDYFYEPANCYQGQCQKFSLWARLEKEPIYKRTSLEKLAEN